MMSLPRKGCGTGGVTRCQAGSALGRLESRDQSGPSAGVSAVLLSQQPVSETAESHGRVCSLSGRPGRD